MNSPKLSIIMPMYGVEEFVAEAILSVKNQKFDDWELIIVNDGSKDNSKSVAISAAGQDPRIRIVDKRNGGLSDARNFGLALASGEYVHFFDSDDWISEDFYTTLLGDIERTDSDIVISGYTVETLKASGKYEPWVKHMIPLSSEPGFCAMFLSGYMNFAWNKLFRRSFLKENKLTFEYGLKLIEDCEFMSRVVHYSPKIEFSASTAYHYRNINRPTLSRFFDQSLIRINCRRIKCSEKILNFLNPDINIGVALDIIRFNAIRSLLHSLFVFTRKMSFADKVKVIRSIMHSNELMITKRPQELSLFEKILWFSIKHKHVLSLALIYQVKSKFIR